VKDKQSSQPKEIVIKHEGEAVGGQSTSGKVGERNGTERAAAAKTGKGSKGPNHRE
jgi:hypothetical protein